MDARTLDVAYRAVRLYAETHPRPSHVTMTQAGEMLGISTHTLRKMVRGGFLKVDRKGAIPIEEIDRIVAA